jgi:hypothetical protein
MTPRPVFFVDRSLGKAVGAALRAAGAAVELHDDHFAGAAPDDQWIPEVTNRGWVILTKDKTIRRRPDELQALLTSRARVFTLPSGNLRGDAMAERFVRHLPEMERLALSQPPPFVANLYHDGPQLILPRQASALLDPPPPPAP